MKKLITIHAVTAVLALLCLGGSPAFAGWTVVSLHPAGAEGSCANGVSGGQQVGYAWFSGNYHAGLWSGTAASWADLNPAGATYSGATGISGGQQVGNAWFVQFGGVNHAGLWRGTAESWVDLNPAGATSSSATGVSGGKQVGYAMIGGNSRASLWSGTAESWVDLHALLPAGVYTQSSAYGIDVSAGEIWVAGHADDEAMLWHYTDELVPTPVEQIEQILEFTENSVAYGRLEGVGPGRSADNKLGALVNMLQVAGGFMISENYDMACDQLTAALAKCDGQSPPPDFVDGDATDDLATMIQELIMELYEML